MLMLFNGAVALSDRSRAPSVPDVAVFAREVADPSRASMLISLMDGRAWTVGELARAAGIAPNTASEHARRLVGAGLLTEARQGRHRYLTLAGSQIAEALEAIALVSPMRPAANSLRAHRYDDELAAGRTCYRHLAGRLGVSLLEGWITSGLLTEAWDITRKGYDWFAQLDIDTQPVPRRARLRPCIDWTERRPHAAGVLADRLTAAAFDRGWLIRGTHPRSARLTAVGEHYLRTTHPLRSEP